MILVPFWSPLMQLDPGHLTQSAQVGAFRDTRPKLELKRAEGNSW